MRVFEIHLILFGFFLLAIWRFIYRDRERKHTGIVFLTFLVEITMKLLIRFMYARVH